MRPAVICLLLVAFAAADEADEPWVEEEDLAEAYVDDEEHHRIRRETYVERPLEEHVRVKRRDCEGVQRDARPADHVRKRRQVHQYEVHEFVDDSAPTTLPYEQMLAASAEHHRVFVVPAPARARSLSHSAGPQPGPPNSNVIRPDSGFVPSLGPVNAATGPVQFVSTHVSPSLPKSVAVNAPVLGPVPVAAEPASLPPQLLSPADQVVAAAGHHGGHSHGHDHGGGHEAHAKHYGQHGSQSKKGFKTDQHSDKGGKGYKLDEHHRKEYEEAAGKKKKHHDRAGHRGSHDEQAHGARGSHFGEKKGHKKGHKTKGFHNKYHKDEFHKEHKFYDDFHKAGEHHRYGKFNAKHASNESGKKKAHHVNAGHDFMERGKKGYSNKGHLDADHKGHNAKHGHDEHNEKHSSYGKKGGKQGGSHWGYAKKQ